MEEENEFESDAGKEIFATSISNQTELISNDKQKKPKTSSDTKNNGEKNLIAKKTRNHSQNNQMYYAS